LIGLATSGRTPFTADLYFVNLRDMPQVGWGTRDPIIMETPGRGMGVVLLSGRGVIDIGVDDPVRFVKQYAVGKPVTRLSDIHDRIQATLLGEIASLLGASGAQSVPDANRLLSDLEGAMLARLNEKFQALGMRIKAFEAVPFTAQEATLDQIRNYVSAEAYERYANERRFGIAEEAARNPGVGGAMASAGVGFGVGQQMAQMFQSQPAQPSAPPAGGSAANPKSREEVQALLDALDARLVSGEISEATYKTLVEKWQKRLDEFK
jgi:membrane protease subunit (stomatin/prohibitin family)